MRIETDLRKYQERMISWVTKKPCSGLFVDMGLGKTVAVLTAKQRRVGKHGGMFVIAPLRVCETVWEQEGKEWEHLHGLKFVSVLGNERQRTRALRMRADVYLMNVDNLPWLATALYAMQQQGIHIPFDWLVIDESSAFKSTGTRRFAAIRALLPAFPRRTILTGTPSPNSLLDLWPQLFILDQGASLGRTIEHYRERYFEMDEEIGRYVPKQGAVPAINAAIAPLVLRIPNTELDGMPKVNETEIAFDLPRTARRIYDEIERSMFIELDSVFSAMRDAGRRGLVEAVNAAVLIGKCHQIANGAVFDSEDRTTWHEIHRARLDTLAEILEEINTPVLIAYSYRHDRERLIKLLGPNTPYIGAGNKDTLGVVERWNRGEIPHLIAHAKSAGHGLNMQKGPGFTVIWFSNIFSRELYDQLIARIARSGQASPFVNVHSIVARNTVDAAMRAALERKARGQAELLNTLREYQRGRMKELMG
jgi:SNF2 family DNA or RNA helicase